MEQIAYSQEVGALLAACDLPVADLRDGGRVRFYLLTTTADRFFEQLGYETLSRSEAPSAITATPQFSGLCPGSSIFMGKELGANAL